MTKEEKQTLEQLRKEKDYEQIFKQFGQKEFIRNVDKKYKKDDIKKLQKEGKFEDIYLRYGEKTYNKYLRKFKQKEIEDIYGKISFQALKGRIRLIGLALLTATGVKYGIEEYLQPTIDSAQYTIKNAEAFREVQEEEYKELIQEYENSIKEYADNINKLKLTDFETIMKVQEDMWASIEGYADPELDVEACLGLDIYASKTGICRNMADDFARKLNAIDPKYNARVCSVKLTEEEVIGEMANISKISFDLEEPNKPMYVGLEVDIPNWKEITDANHSIVLVDINEDNLTLIVDPTNLSVGVFKNGKIRVLNAISEHQENVMERKVWKDFIFRDDISIYDIPKEYAKSFIPSKLSKEKIEEKYGVEAQNNALMSAEKKEQEYIYQSSKKEESFKSSLQVNSKDNIYSVEEIKNTYETCVEMLDRNITKEEFSKIIQDYGKLYESIQYYNNKKEEMMGAKILNPSMLIQSKLNIDLTSFTNKLSDKKCSIQKNETNNIREMQNGQGRERE